MPELPDVTVYRERMVAMLGGQPLQGVRLFSPFVLRSVEPPIQSLFGNTLRDVERLGKRLVLVFDDDLFLVLHLMIAGRLRWRKPGAKPPGKMGLAAFDFAPGTLMLTEAATKKRASLHVVHGRPGLAEFDRGGLEVMDTDLATFAQTLRRENRTLKRTMTDPRILSGVGNAYSDEILHAARLSPTQLTSNVTDDEMARLFAATIATLRAWTDRLRTEVGAGFPEEVTAFREGMAVHGRYKEPCPVCGTPVQHILYASNECNYCPTCQTGGRLLADRGLSQLMRKDWPKTLEELEEKKGRG